jgi:hypothetical protein
MSFQNEYVDIQRALERLKSLQSQGGFQGDGGRCLAVAITNLETGLLWLEKASEEAGFYLNKAY